MPFCPSCRQEYVHGALVCADCDLGLVPVLPPTPPLEGPETEEADVEEDDAALVEVWRSRGEMETQVVRSLLRSAGIPSMARGEVLRITHGFTLDGLAEVRILVRAHDEDMARRLIVADRLTTCPGCGERFETGQTLCRSCGERLQGDSGPLDGEARE